MLDQDLLKFQSRTGLVSHSDRVAEEVRIRKEHEFQSRTGLVSHSDFSPVG